MTVFFVKLAAFLLVAAAVAVGVVPLLVLFDLLRGGSGWGLCPYGLEACDIPYTAGAELTLVLLVVLFVLVLGIRLLMRLARRLRDDTYQVSQ